MKPLDPETEVVAAMARDDWTEVARLEKVIDDLDVHPQPPSLHAAALWYAEQGLRVFPLRIGGKHPLLPKAHPEDAELQRSCKGRCGRPGHGLYDAANDTDQVAQWWTGEPRANIGLATGHLVDVVDIDGLKGQISRARNWGMFESLVILGKVSTPRPGGLHLLVPPRPGITTGANLLPGVDYRGLGGYVVAPPSRIAPGGKDHPGTYSFVTPLDITALGSVAA